MGVVRTLMLASSACLLAAGCSAGDLPPPLADPPPDAGGPEKGDDVAAPPPCATPTTGCPCGDAGTLASCGVIYRRVGSYVSCSEGYVTCLPNGMWGECEGPTIFDGN